MIRTTPFHPRLSELDDQRLYTHWQGYLSPLRYSHAPKHEYFAVRNSVGVFDTSPLFKYSITGPDAERLLATALVRDVRRCKPGQAHYTIWCDERGHVRQDGVVLRHAADDFLLTAARPCLSWFAGIAEGMRVEIEDVSDAWAMLAVQGPRSRTVLAALGEEATGLGFFDHAPAKIAGSAVTISRTGYTGDLGYELIVPADEAIPVLDAVLEAGQGHGLRPFGEEALMVLRIEAGLVLVDVEWHDSRLAETDAQRVTPTELGMGWMLGGKGAVHETDRAFVGREAIRRELREGTTRWRTTGIVVDWQHWDELHREAGHLPPVVEHPHPYESVLYDAEGAEEVGYTTSFVWSPVLQRHIGLARVRPDLAAPGTPLRQEMALAHHNTSVRVTTTRLPFFNPERKTH